ncbi:MAG TPA: endonuclease domain-containing protein [Pseudolabrys sp.]|nr:endonuclease domain-containing protein [Pseudolabrys sp.]
MTTLRNGAPTRHGPTSPCKGEVARAAGGRGSTPRFSHTRSMTKRARRLRVDPTDAEKKLWRALRRDQMNGLHFRRQHPIGPYTLDFYCPSIRLCIELDGSQHAHEQTQKVDERRTAYLTAHGILVIRYWNNDVLTNLEGVLSDIVRISEERTADRATPSPTLPLSGGGRHRGTP